ncbi:hypothetical protein CYMTET_8624 [Cymbomonas tetramitiformis]|uniref:Uncharacterized protein n=1 Tax=Cymbomonas tetramitiformis TaxID=36881 RepID=A0AAE0GSX4_9CHLO|nr:hypothetical protein CYMTET_8624 [Cymbomonas tetramitiformis]
MSQEKSKRYKDIEIRKSYSIKWNTDLTRACCADPLYCLFAIGPCCCSQCSSYWLRKRALYDDMNRYVCCQGMCPCSGKMGERNCPEACLGLEVICCFAQSVAATRMTIQDERLIENTQCDNCIIGFMLLLNQLACIFRCAAAISGSKEIEQIADILDCLADIVYMSVCACMQTQHKVELDVRDGKKPAKEGCAGAGGQQQLHAPPQQHMQGGAQMAPPPGAYPPAGAYGQPPPGAYGQPPPGAYGQPPPGAYGQPPPGAYGQPPPGAYGQPPPGAYGQPPPGAYGQPPPGAYGQPPPGAYGQPIQYAPQ